MTMILKLQTALNQLGAKILYRTNQFYSMETNSPVTIYYVEQAYLEEGEHKTKKTELFHTTSQLQVVLFLRDLLCIYRNEPLPTENEIWNEKRKDIDYFNTLEK